MFRALLQTVAEHFREAAETFLKENDDLEPYFILAKALACIAGHGTAELRSRSLQTSNEDSVTMLFKGAEGTEIRNPSYVSSTAAPPRVFAAP